VAAKDSCFPALQLLIFELSVQYNIKSLTAGREHFKKDCHKY
jgi:hypothetical protein